MDQKTDPSMPNSSDPGLPPIPEPELPDGLTPVDSSEVVKDVNTPKMVIEEITPAIFSEKSSMMKESETAQGPSEASKLESNVLTGLLKDDEPAPSLVPEAPFKAEKKVSELTPDEAFKKNIPTETPVEKKDEKPSSQSFVVPHDADAIPDTHDDSNPPKPKSKKSGLKTGLIISALFLFISLPVAVYYISEQQSLTDQRKQAIEETGPYPTGGGGSCPPGLHSARVCPTKPGYDPDNPLPGVNSGYQTEGDAVWGCGGGNYHEGPNGNYYCGEDTGDDDGGGGGSNPTSTPIPTATSIPTPTATDVPPTPIPTDVPPTPTATGVPVYQCDGSCSSDAQCPSGTACVNTNGVLRCRNTSCPSESSCNCPSAPTNTPYPTNAFVPTYTPIPTQRIAAGPTSTATPTPTKIISTPTPTQIAVAALPGETPTPTPVPKLPVSGVGFPVLGMTLSIGAVLLILLGLAL